MDFRWLTRLSLCEEGWWFARKGERRERARARLEICSITDWQVLGRFFHLRPTKIPLCCDAGKRSKYFSFYITWVLLLLIIVPFCHFVGTFFLNSHSHQTRTDKNPGNRGINCVPPTHLESYLHVIGKYVYDWIVVVYLNGIFSNRCRTVLPPLFQLILLCDKLEGCEV
ncbi:hypothetical protein F5Y16DRAFT_192242 [Xylariaceae sp. FL0255]|nr:hypothetical protein F5Y16DRAFT_192242 [Xylariaceae sp. FL0255]